VILENKLVERVLEKIDTEDARAVEIMSGGNLTDWGQYQRSAGYRKALADCKVLLNETLEDLMKE
jgi:hypothetical protein